MNKPSSADFGTTEADARWAANLERRLPVVLFLLSAGGWAIYGLVTATSFHPALIVLGLFLGFVFCFLTTLFLMIPAELLLRLALPRYRRAQRYRKALEQFRAWWLRTQKEFWLSLSGLSFEHELAAVFRRAGYKAEVTKASDDKGVDIWLDGGREIVQCKAHGKPVGPGVARELYGTLLHFRAARATLASVSGFTKGVYDYVRDKPINLMGLEEIIALQEKGVERP